jgi:LDH2 family malate/lactate/ureidoglycolate dehydrogenase
VIGPVYAVNVAKRAAYLDTGEQCPITKLLDFEGDETDNPAEAVAAIAPLRSGTWITIDLTQFDPVRLN